MDTSAPSLGEHLREWRRRRRMSQLDLALDAEISARHLSFVETGRAQPSREMVLRLAERLDVPLRERNVLLVAAGFAPLFPERGLNDPALGAARAAIDLVLKGLEPSPALAVDRHWALVAANQAASRLMATVAPAQLAPPVNVLRLSLHPDGLAPHIVNYGEWRGHLLARLKRQVDVSGDPVLAALLEELQGYRQPGGSRAAARSDARPASPQLGEFVVPLQLATEAGLLTLFSTTTVFGTPVDVTLSELALESFFPANAETAATLQRLVR